MPDEIKLWEYRVQQVGSFWSGLKNDELAQLLNEWGLEGWEVVSSASLENAGKITIIAKRLLSDRVRHRRTMP